jgi:hypothetical protein
MSNWIDWTLDVLAASPVEINKVAVRLKYPSPELANWVAEKWGASTDEVADSMKTLLAFESVRNLGYIDDAINKARSFRLAFKDKFSGIIRSQLYEVSTTFPTAIFLLTYRDLGNYSGKEVIRAGQTVQSVHDGNQQAQGQDWALLDIFAPFWAEYDLGVAFGSLWQQWVGDIITAANNLKAQRPG